jgi:hypothetical protein
MADHFERDIVPAPDGGFHRVGPWRTTNTFSMDCPSCGPGTVQFLDGEMVPHGCSYEPPSLVLRCEGDPMSSSTLVRGHRRRRAQDAAATVAACAIALVGTAVVLSPIVWGLISFWRWVL